MKNESTRKVINVDKPNYVPLFEFKELDNAVIRLSLFKASVEFDITGQTVKLGAKTSKGLKEQSEGFTINKNNLDIDLKNSILVPGTVEIDLELKDASGTMTTASFFITVKSKVLNDKAVEGTNEFDTFTKTAAKIEEDYKGLRRIIIDENQAANLQDQVNQTNAQLDTMKQQKANQNDLEVQKSRIDNLTKLGEGSTTGDAELQDVRVGVNGLIYQNAGDAVREIGKGKAILDNSIYISKIKGSKVLKTQNMFNYEKAQTGILRSDGSVDTSIFTNVTSEFIEINNDIVKNYKASESCNICFYGINKNLLKFYSNQNYVSSVLGAKYIRVSPLATSYKFMLASNINTLPTEFIAPVRKELVPFELDKNSTSINCIKEIIKTYSNNLFDKNNITKGYSVSNTKGYLVKNESYCSSDFIEVIENTQYEISKGVNLAFYDADCQYISGLSYTNSKIFTTPQNCKYCRISVLLTDLDMFMMAKNNLPLIYEPYVRYSFDESLFEFPFNIPHMKNILKGKIINCLGDSFTNTAICWHKHIADRTGCIINNYGVSGSAIASYSNPYAETFVERYNSMTSECDIVVVFGGLNDAYTLSKGRITLGDMNSTELTTFYGALKTLSEGLIAKYPDKLILALLPPNVIKNAESGADTRYTKINEIVEAEKEVYTHYGIPYLDLRTGSTISTTDAHISLYNASPTNLHWNEAGHKRASYPIQKFIESYTY